MRAIILAAGRGSRLQKLTEDRPKCLVELAGRSLLDYQLAALRAAGIEQVALVTGYRREQLSGRTEREFHNPRWQDTGILASLMCAAEWLDGGDCIVSYSDIFYPASFVRHLAQERRGLAMAYDPKGLELWTHRFADPLSDAESLVVREDGTLVEIGAKRPEPARVQGQYIGLVRTSPTAWRHAIATVQEADPAAMDRLDITGLLSALIRRHVPVYGVPVTGVWGEVDNERDLHVYRELHAERLPSLPD